MKIWAENKCNSNSSVTCPTCRSNWEGVDGRRALQKINQEFDEFANRAIIHKGTKCFGCNKKNIKGRIYKCLNCTGVTLCNKCFYSFEHYEHQQFFMRNNVNEAWKPAPNRKEILEATGCNKNEYFNFYSDGMLENEIVDINMKKQEFIIDQNILSYIFSSLPQEKGTKKGDALSIIGVKKVKEACEFCKIQSGNLVKLVCGDYLCENCLTNIFCKQSVNSITCPICGCIFLKGLNEIINEQLIGKNAIEKKVIKKPQKQKYSSSLTKFQQKLELQSDMKQNLVLNPLNDLQILSIKQNQIFQKQFTQKIQKPPLYSLGLEKRIADNKMQQKLQKLDQLNLMLVSEKKNICSKSHLPRLQQQFQEANTTIEEQSDYRDASEQINTQTPKITTITRKNNFRIKQKPKVGQKFKNNQTNIQNNQLQLIIEPTK